MTLSLTAFIIMTERIIDFNATFKINVTQHNDIEHNDAQNNGLNCDIQHK